MTDAEPDFDEMSDAACARWLEANREVGEAVVDAEVSAALSSVVSVRFPAGEIAAVERAATAAGMKLSTYIRQAALAAAHTVNIDEARRDLSQLRSTVDKLARHVGTA